jgi:hypothetical protein
VSTAVVLAGHPDARRARLPLFEPALLAGFGALLGPLAAAAGALWNGLALGRPRLALSAALLGGLGWLAIAGAGHTFPSVDVLLARLLGLGCGTLLWRLQRAHARGHAFLGGVSLPTLSWLLLALLGALALPSALLRPLQGLP